MDLELEESNTVVLDSMACARQRNLTVNANSLANNISLTCLPLGILMPSPQIVLLVEGTYICSAPIKNLVGKTCPVPEPDNIAAQFWTATLVFRVRV